MSDFKFNCPHCKQSLEAPPELMGQVIACPSCSGSIQLPQAQTMPLPAVPVAGQKKMIIRKAQSSPSFQTATRPAPSAPTRFGSVKSVILILFGIFVVFLIVNLTGQIPSTPGGSSFSPQSEQLSVIPWGELDAIYNTPERYSDLQKNEIWKKYKGKRVQWAGQVVSVDDSWGSLTVQIKMSPRTMISDILLHLPSSKASGTDK